MVIRLRTRGGAARGSVHSRMMRAAAVVAVAVAALLAGPMTSPASAGTCGTPFCGGVVNNNSGSSIAVTNCWTSGGFYYGETHPCMTNGWNLNAYNAGVSIGPLDSSSGYYYYYDVDGFRVYRGCVVTVRYNGGNEQFYSASSGSSMWVRLTGTTQATIVRQTC